jgi:hypothetical protein
MNLCDDGSLIEKLIFSRVFSSIFVVTKYFLPYPVVSSLEGGKVSSVGRYRNRQTRFFTEIYKNENF